MAKPEPCNARNREWHRCELERHDKDHDHWSLEGGRWSETLTISGDATRTYLSDETGRIVAERPSSSDELRTQP